MTVKILCGDVIQQLDALPDKSVHCCVTSPPYWGLRAYGGQDGMIGLEATFEQHVKTIVAVFREVRRVLRDDGTLWLNYGDAYASSPPGNKAKGQEKWKTSGLHGGKISEKYADTLDQSQGQKRNTVGAGAKPKDLLMMPAQIALALRDDGWFLRSEIVWHKLNPMPESATDRPTTAHEKLFLFSKKPRYFYDQHAVRVPGSPNTHARRRDGERAAPVGHDPGDNRPGTWKDTRTIAEQAEIGSNLRNVWPLTNQPYKQAHFATFPTKLVEPCIKAGTSEKGVCPACGAPWARDVQRTKGKSDRKARGKALTSPRQDGNPWNENNGRGFIPMITDTTGWSPSCTCPPTDPIPATVLDPFAGSGTVGLVADRLQRDAVLVEINPEYADMARQRIQNDAGLFGPEA